ncbi:hypothetical protein tb265_16930 [Gemmatimonadetes bacterium T265]|nr:hypothetical protein tb265_16930 [Gemmatimonadetes bacterium T265]
MRTSIIARVAPAAAVLAIALPAAARAQNAAIVNNPAKVEFGADVGANFGLGKYSYTNFFIPGERFRVGFFGLIDNPRIEVEPAVGFNYSKQKDAASLSRYNLELGVLYHFRAPTYVSGVTGATVAYVRPFVNYTGTHSGSVDDVASTSAHQTTLGAGLGLKLPVRPNIALRGEANLGYDFTSKAARVGLLAGGSFFAFR